jgi:RNase P subunit RPR2
LRYSGVCSKCRTPLAKSTEAHWEKATKTITCLQCEPAQEVETTESLESIVTEKEPPVMVKPESGVAGASAKQEYERRHQKRDEMLDRRFGRFARVVKFLSDDPQSTRAWAKGSSGEQLLAAALEKRVGDRAVILNDRKIPRSSANIDHIVIAASGVWIVDAKKYEGRLQRRDKGGWRKVDYHVYVSGRDQTRLVGGLHK